MIARIYIGHWETLEYIKISAKENLCRYEKKQHKRCFDEEGLHFDHRKQVKIK